MLSDGNSLSPIYAVCLRMSHGFVWLHVVPSGHTVYMTVMAAQAGLEPTMTASKAVVLPLHHCAIYCMAAVEQ